VSRERPDFARSALERCWVDGDLIRLSQWPLGGIRPGVRGEPVPWLMDLGVLEEAMQGVYGRGFRLGDRAPLLQLAADALAEGDRSRAAEIADAVAFPAPEFKSRFRDAGLRYLAWGPAHRRGNPRVDIDAWLARTDIERKYDPDQPRVPRGHPDGGQWTDDGRTEERAAFDPDQPLDQEEWEAVEKLRSRVAELEAEHGNRSALLQLAANRKPSKSVEFYLETIKWALEKYPFLKRTGMWGNLIWELFEVVPNVAAFLEEPKSLDDIVADQEDHVFSSEAAFRSAYGSAGLGKDWHHIIEKGQDPDNKRGLNLHHTKNIVRVPRLIHWTISAHYSEKSPVPGLTMREWLWTQPLEYQREYGLWILSWYGGVQ
jgi:hypothetical protein